MNENEKAIGSRRNGKASAPPPAVLTPTQTEEWTYKGWYEKNKEALSQRRKKRYRADKKYREKILEQNKDYRVRRSQENPSPDKAKVRTPKHRKPVSIKVTIGKVIQDVSMVHIGAFARAIGRSVPTIHQWERVGLLPKTPFLLDGKNKQERLYTADMIGVVRTALSTRGTTISASDRNFHQEIEDGWKALGVHMADES
jgi:DNA-binding transcriptional regulator YiaG